MPSIIGEIVGFGSDQGCPKKPTIKRAFFAERLLVDWEAMRVDPTKFDPTTKQVLGYTYNTGGKHVEVKFDRNSGQFDATYTEDNKFYDIILLMILSGKAIDRTDAIRRLVDCCDLTAHLYMADGTERIVGPEYDFEDDLFIEPVKKLAVSRHLDSQGTRGGDDPRDEIDFNNQVDYAPLYGNVPVAELIASAAPAVTRAYGPVGGDGTRAYGPVGGDGTRAYGPVGGPVEASATAAAKTTRKPKAKTLKA